jgi:hypothetical protein
MGKAGSPISNVPVCQQSMVTVAVAGTRRPVRMEFSWASFLHTVTRALTISSLSTNCDGEFFVSKAHTNLMVPTAIIRGMLLQGTEYKVVAHSLNVWLELCL